MLVQIDYELRFAAPFHLGTGITTGLIDRTVSRDASGALYVPASTFKGVLREHCEHLSRFYLPDIEIASPHNAFAALAQFGQTPTPITRIFGSPLHPGGLCFNDARQQHTPNKWEKRMQTSLLTQARIDRITHTAVDEALYTSEFGASNLVFLGTIKGQLNCTPIDDLTALIPGKKPYNLTPTYSLLLLLAGILMIEQLGGNKSTGKGQCTCTIIRLLLDKCSCPKGQWQSWIEQLEVLQGYSLAERGAQP